ncbi:tryptophan synthase subunit alpha [Entomobacter blattae]|uniref:Tryptophan synthase alpha chain n=1 Tax=Entomobacter blattae TaxID=2762277 RepID=A0A7H1NPP1_9PROT|nr:tryptophan synthase subunit alpha [Entomobacter blattae]QNT77751.1 Tryptophan synthase alpha chain [Entomobacter blattae]
MSRIAQTFNALKKQNKGAFISYLEACDPDYNTSLALLKAMPEAGADLIEIGMPFSDPMADGPVIQEAAKRSLKAGATMAKTLSLVRTFRQENTTTPLILMGYLNPVENYGVERFCHDAAQAGVDGLIIVDVPPEEAAFLSEPAQKNGIDVIRLITPTSTDERLEYITSQASGFLYYVSINGITGTRTASTEQLNAAFSRIRKKTDLPVVVGFGLSTPEHIRQALTVADGAVVASALIKTLANSLDANHQATEQTLPAVLSQLKTLADAKH